MKAWVLKGINNFEYEEVTQPSDSDDRVLVKVKACGICGSDIPRVYRDGAHNMPLIIGHEFAGEVVQNGRRVGVFPLIPCFKCEQCKKKQYEMCTDYDYLGSRSNGGLAEYVSVPKWNLIDLPDKVLFEQAAMLEPMAVAVHAIRRVKLVPDDKVVVIGLGTIGLFITMFLKQRGIKDIVAIGNKDFQRQYAQKLGVIYDTDATKYNADVVFECVGKQVTVNTAIDICNANARICLVGNPFSNIELEKSVYWKVLRKQLYITGTWNSAFTHEEVDDWHYVINCLINGSIHPEDFITHRFPLEEIDKGFEIMKNKTEDYIKIIFEQRNQ